MPIAWLCQIDAYARSDGGARPLRFASHDDDRLCHLNEQVWWPSIERLPTLSYDFFDGAFAGEIATPSGQADICLEAVPAFAEAMLHGARIRWWSGELGDAWGSFTLRFDGIVDNQPTIKGGVASVDFRVDDRWLDDPILSTYAGTTGAEGEAALKGQVKPLLLGAPRMVEGVLINSIDTIIQLSDGPIAAVEVGMENAARFAAPVADYASYAALQAATIAPGYFATALAVGLVRHGAPPAGVLTYDVQGSSSGPDGATQPRRVGSIVKRLAARMGRSDKVDAAGMAAIDVARPWDVSVALQQQTTMRELVQPLAQSVNAVALVTWTGQLTLLPVPTPESATPLGTLASDGSSPLPVGQVDQLGIAAPFWRLAIEAEITNRVHGNDEIRFTAELIDRGRYNSAESYREGHIVDMADGSRWLYVSVTPTTGNAPPNWPTTSDAYWANLTPPADRGKFFLDVSPPSAANSNPGDIWQDTDGRYWIRRADNHLSIGGNRLMIGGSPLTMTWTPAPTQPVRNQIDAALSVALSATAAAAQLAQDAQATADGKVQSYYQPGEPYAEGVGDLWFDTDDGNKQYRWAGSAWEPVQDTGIGAAITAAAGAQATADGKVTTFFSESTPTAEAVGDLWFKPSTSYLKRWDGSTWADIANIGATPAQVSQITSALTNAANAQATADGKVDTYYQTSAPGGGTIGDLWFDTDDGNKLYRHNGTSWVVAQDSGIGAAITAAAGAQATADGKVTTFISESTPTAQAVGDLWFKASTGQLRRWSGSSWGNALVDLTATAQVTITPPVAQTVQRDWQGNAKAGQLPRILTPTVTKGGVNFRTDSSVSYTVTGTSGLNGFVTVNNTNGSADKGKITIPTTIEGSGVINLAVSVGGVPQGTFSTQVDVVDDPPPSGSGGSGSGGTASINGSFTGTTPVAISGELSVTVGAGGIVRLNAEYSYYTNATGGSSRMQTQFYEWNGSSWVAVGTLKNSTIYLPEVGEANGQNSVELTGRTTGSTKKYKLYGRAAFGSDFYQVAGSMSATTE